MPRRTIFLRLLSGTICIATVTPAFAASDTFRDVPTTHFAHDAIVYLSDRNILSGYADGTFRPDQKVNRAEALKIVASAFVPKSGAKVKSTEFADVPDNAWYLPSIEWALDKKVIDGPAKTKKFYPSRTVTKAEFLKMLFASEGVDLKSFNDIVLALSSDTENVRAWYYPALRYAVATGTTVISDAGTYGPDRPLTRADVAVLLYRFLLYKSGQRTQDLLTLTQQDVKNVITALAKGDPDAADFASVRAILIARAALLSEPNEAVVKVAVKISEGYRALTRAYRASLEGDLASVLKLSADAATLAGQARALSPDAKTLADQLESYSKSFAKQVKK